MASCTGIWLQKVYWLDDLQFYASKILWESMSFGGMTIKNTPTMRAVLSNNDLSFFERVPATGPPAGNAVKETVNLGV